MAIARLPESPESPVPKSFPAVFKSVVSAQDEPSHCSVLPTIGGEFPPKITAEVEVPPPPKFLLAVFTFAISVQPVPFQLSTFTVLGL